MNIGDDDASGGLNTDVDLKLHLVEADRLYRWRISNHDKVLEIITTLMPQCTDQLLASISVGKDFNITTNTNWK